MSALQTWLPLHSSPAAREPDGEAKHTSGFYKSGAIKQGYVCCTLCCSCRVVLGGHSCQTCNPQKEAIYRLKSPVHHLLLPAEYDSVLDAWTRRSEASVARSDLWTLMPH